MKVRRMGAPHETRAFLAAALLVTASATTRAEVVAVTDQQQAAFERMIYAPLDHQSTFSYVTASAQNLDYEGAIAALERILAYNPHLARAHYELGVLYFRLRSYAQAVIHFEEALAASDLDPALARRIEGYLPEARKQLQRSRFTGILQFGVRYNSNVTGMPGSGFIQAFGLDVPSLRPYQKDAGGSFFGSSEIEHVYDLENGRGDTWETQFTGYGALQFHYTSLNLGFFDVTTGPRLALSPEALPGWTVRPYAATSGSTVYDGQYNPSYGGGLTIVAPITPLVAVETGFEGRRVEYNAFTELPVQGTLFAGVLWRGQASAIWRVTENVVFKGTAFGGHNAADSGPMSTSHYGLEGALKIDFAPPSEEIGMSWSVMPFVRYLAIDFECPNPIVQPFYSRRDRQFRVGSQLNMPFSSTIGVSAVAQYDLYDSNIPNYRSSGGSFLVGPTIRF